MIQLFDSLEKRVSKARDTADLEAKLKSLVAHLLPVGHDLAAEIQLRIATRMINSKQVREAITICREVLQVRLTSSGPKDPLAMRAMYKLGRAIAAQLVGNNADPLSDPLSDPLTVHSSTFLGRVSVQLRLGNKNIREVNEHNLLINLLFTLRSTGQCEEAVNVG